MFDEKEEKEGEAEALLKKNQSSETLSFQNFFDGKIVYADMENRPEFNIPISQDEKNKNKCHSVLMSLNDLAKNKNVRLLDTAFLRDNPNNDEIIVLFIDNKPIAPKDMIRPIQTVLNEMHVLPTTAPLSLSYATRQDGYRYARQIALTVLQDKDPNNNFVYGQWNQAKQSDQLNKLIKNALNKNDNPLLNEDGLFFGLEETLKKGGITTQLLGLTSPKGKEKKKKTEDDEEQDDDDEQIETEITQDSINSILPLLFKKDKTPKTDLTLKTFFSTLQKTEKQLLTDFGQLFVTLMNKKNYETFIRDLSRADSQLTTDSLNAIITASKDSRFKLNNPSQLADLAADEETINKKIREINISLNQRPMPINDNKTTTTHTVTATGDVNELAFLEALGQGKMKGINTKTHITNCVAYDKENNHLAAGTSAVATLASNKDFKAVTHYEITLTTGTTGTKTSTVTFWKEDVTETDNDNKKIEHKKNDYDLSNLDDDTIDATASIIQQAQHSKIDICQMDKTQKRPYKQHNLELNLSTQQRAYAFARAHEFTEEQIIHNLTREEIDNAMQLANKLKPVVKDADRITVRPR